jgi:CNP1-like family
MAPGNTGKSDWELEQDKRDWREAETPAPPLPGSGELLPFFVTSASDYRFLIDAASLAPGADGVVRYTLIVRSPLGGESVTYEGIRCATREVKTYAYGGADRSWSVRPGNWRRIEARSVQRWHDALWREYFCPRELPIRSAAEGVDALRRGGHPGRIAIPARGY